MPRSRSPEKTTARISADELSVLASVGLRLAAEAHAVLKAISPVNLSIRELAATLALDATICQRVIATARCTATPIEAVRQCPGVEGLRMFVEAARRRRVDERTLEGLTAAVERLNRALDELGCSHSRLRERLDGVSGLKASGPTDRSQRQMFKLAANWSGQQLVARVGMIAVRPAPSDPLRIEARALTAFVGYRGSGALPFGSTPIPSQPGEGVPAEHGVPSTHPELVRELCRGSIRMSERKESGLLVLVADVVEEQPGLGSDVVTRVEIPPVAHPAQDAPPHFVSMARMRYPTMTLVNDVYMHRSLAAACVPQSGCVLGDPRMLHDLTRAWEEHLPCPTQVQLLAPKIAGAATKAWDRAAEGAAMLFDRPGWDRSQFVGYRLEIQFPIWGATYFTLFDFGTREPTPS